MTTPEAKRQRHYPEEWGPSDNRRLTCVCGNSDPFHAVEQTLRDDCTLVQDLRENADLDAAEHVPGHVVEMQYEAAGQIEVLHRLLRAAIAERDQLREEFAAATENILWCQAFRAQQEPLARDAGRYRFLRDWLTASGLLHREDFCTRPDRTHGAAWILRRAYSIAGDSVVGWAPDSADAAIDSAMEATRELP